MMNQNPEIIIIGAGAAGLMAARELGKAGKKVLILEARDRIGGRILSLNESDFGYPAQGGAEWVHGEAPVTRGLIKEADLTLIPEDGEIWSNRTGTLSLHKQFIEGNGSLKEKLAALKEDISIADFLEQNFTDEKDADFKNSVIKATEGYDAADPKLVSTFMLKDEFLNDSEWNDGRIKEGYTALLKFLEDECVKYAVKFVLNTPVKKIRLENADVAVQTLQKEFRAKKVVVTVPLPLLKEIEFEPNINEKIKAASKIGFGNVIKVLIKFKTRWWEHIQGKDLSKMAFLLCNEKFLTWWTQYPEINPVLTGWMAGPEAGKYKDASSEELLDLALDSLSNALKVSKEKIKSEIALSKVFNWPADPFTKGAYSYTTYKTGDAYAKLVEPIDDAIFFAGEALYSGHATATVEGALGSGLETAQKILSL